MRVTVESLPGVENAVVSLNEGLVTIEFASDNDLTLSRIRAAIRDQGFSPREAAVRIRGSLVERAGTLELTAGEQVFTLSPPGQVERFRDRLGQRVTVDGRVGSDVDGVTPGALELVP